MAQSQAIWLLKPKEKPFTIKESEFYEPEADEVIVKSHAVAMNPVEYMVQDADPFGAKYPRTVGCDVAGEAVSVGEKVTNIKKGDMVLGHAIGLITERPQDGAFQTYVAIKHNLCAPLPSSVTPTAAAVIPLAISTAAHGLYDSEYNALPPPSTDPTPSDKVVLVWGGSSSVGTAAIQLAISSGFEVVTTASPHNFNYVKAIGATQAINAHSDTVVDDVVDALKGKTLAGVFDAISARGTTQKCGQILAKTSAVKKFIATTLPDAPTELEDGTVKAKSVFAPAIAQSDVGKHVYIDYLPKALQSGAYKALPKANVVGKGWDKIQEALDTLKAGVSASKIVVEV